MHLFRSNEDLFASHFQHYSDIAFITVCLVGTLHTSILYNVNLSGSDVWD